LIALIDTKRKSRGAKITSPDLALYMAEAIIYVVTIPGTFTDPEDNRIEVKQIADT
jgi:hypothetical protein